MAAGNKHVGIIGGGISGLSAAFALRQKGFEVTLYEKRARPGGVIRTVEEDGWLVELGPNTLLVNSDALRELIDGLNLSDRVVQAGRESKKRFIVKDGKPAPVPVSLPGFLKTDLLSTGAKFRLFKEPFVSRDSDNSSVDEFFEDRLGREVADYLVNPFIAGVYAGDPGRLSMQHTFSSVYALEQEYGSLFKGALKSAWKRKDRNKKNSGLKGLISFRQGLNELIDSLQSQLNAGLRLESEVTGFSINGKKWQLDIKGERHPKLFDSVIYAAPLHQLRDIRTEPQLRTLLDDLSELRYAPIATVALGFEHSQVEHPLDGFGMLVPELESRFILGCLFSSSLFQNRSPESHHLLTSFIGGERNPELVDKTAAELRELALEDLRPLLGITGDPVFSHIHKWKRAIPQYELNHQVYLDRLDELEEQNPGLFFTGNFRHEVSVPGCITHAYETASRTASFLES